jgi:chemotaxis protein methyltransferase CheR
MEGFEVEHDFPDLGRKTMLLDARKVRYEDSPRSTILLAFTDITARRAIEREKEILLKQTEELLHQKHILLQEMQHRVANSLQIIASILMLKARAVASGETRQQLEDAHRRVMSVATVQLHLHPADNIDQIDVAPYLSKLCASLAASMVGESQPIAIEVCADDGSIDSAKAVSLGLIVTELVINAVKYAFPINRAEAAVTVAYRRDGMNWTLGVSDNGVGKSTNDAAVTGGGLGTAIVLALAKQLGARVEVVSDADSISIFRGLHGSRIDDGYCHKHAMKPADPHSMPTHPTTARASSSCSQAGTMLRRLSTKTCEGDFRLQGTKPCIAQPRSSAPMSSHSTDPAKLSATFALN